MPDAFRWNHWNVDHIGEHGILPDEAEYIVTHARRPWPRKIDDDKYLVWGQTHRGDYIQVIFVLDRDSVGQDTAYVIHARPLSESEKRRLRRSRR